MQFPTLNNPTLWRRGQHAEECVARLMEITLLDRLGLSGL